MGASSQPRASSASPGECDLPDPGDATRGLHPRPCTARGRIPSGATMDVVIESLLICGTLAAITGAVVIHRRIAGRRRRKTCERMRAQALTVVRIADAYATLRALGGHAPGRDDAVADPHRSGSLVDVRDPRPAPTITPPGAAQSNCRALHRSRTPRAGDAPASPPARAQRHSARTAGARRSAVPHERR